MAQTAIIIHILPQKRHLTHALLRQLCDLHDDIIKWPADLLTAGIWHNAETAILAASFHDRNEGRYAIGMRLWQVIKFLNFRKTDVDDRLRANRVLLAVSALLDNHL